MSLESWFRAVTTTVILSACILPACAITGKDKAWAMFDAAAKSTSVSTRATGIRALGLLHGDAHARDLAEAALSDDKPEVRVAAATALGQMRATDAIPMLQKLLSDEKVSVVMAAAHSLRDLKDNASAYGVYYDVLTGAKKGESMIAQQMDTLRNPKALAEIGLEQGIGFVPFAGIGWDAWRYTHKKDPNPVRAVAASLLAHDPDPATGVALTEAMKDKDWIVRAAAVEALAQRGDPAVLDKVELKLFDSNPHVRYTAAAAVIRLSALKRGKNAPNPASAKGGDASTAHSF